MSSLRLPRWTAVLVVPLLVGAFLLMHGLDAGATTAGLHGASAVADHPHQGETPIEHHEPGCDGCAIGHVMAACVAIMVTVVGLHLARRADGAPLSTLVDMPVGSIRALRRLLRPPEPAWVRLAVMRC